MTEGLKSNWKKVGKDFATLGKDLGVSIVKTVKTGVDAANEWVTEKDDAEKTEPQEKRPLQ